MMLRSLKQAKYSPFNDGHFGLAAEYYCHFTSPIRRNPDLQIHRIIKETLQGKLSKDRIADLDTMVAYAADQASKQERIAEKAERDTQDLKRQNTCQTLLVRPLMGLLHRLLLLECLFNLKIP